MKDEVIDEIRAVRKKLDALIKNDPNKFRNDIKKIESDYKSRLIFGKPKYKKLIAA